MDPASIGIAIAATRSLLRGAKNVRDIASGLDDLFAAESEAAKNKKKGQPRTRTQQVVGIRSGDDNYADETSLSNVVSDVLEDRQNEMNKKALIKEIQAKWGKDAWAQIEQEMAKRKEAQKKRKEAARAKALENKLFWKKVAMETLKGAVVIAVIAGFVIWLWYLAESK
jgi:CHASE3 domain sensor protein